MEQIIQMAKYIIRILLFVSYSLCPTAVMSQEHKEMEKTVFDSWRNLTSQQLLDKSRQLIKSERNIDTAMLYMSEVVNRYYAGSKSDDDTDMFLRAMNNMGYVYLNFFNDYQKAFVCFNHALKVAKAKNDKSSLAYLYLNLSNMYGIVGMVHDTYSAKQALDCYQLAVSYSAEAKEWECLQVSLGNMADMAYATNMTNYVRKTLEKYKKTSFPKGTPLIEYNRLLIAGNQAVARKNYTMALECYKKMEACVDTEISPEKYVAAAYNHQAEVYSLMGNRNMALSMLGKMHDVIERHNLKYLKVEYYKSMCDLYNTYGDANLSQHFQLEYYKLKDSLENVGKLKNIRELHFFAKLQDANEEIIVMAKQRQLLYVIVTLVCLFTMVTVAGLLVIWRKNKKLRASHLVMFHRVQEQLRNDMLMQRTIRDYERKIKEINHAKDTHLKAQSIVIDKEEKVYIYIIRCVRRWPYHPIFVNLILALENLQKSLAIHTLRYRNRLTIYMVIISMPC